MLFQRVLLLSASARGDMVQRFAGTWREISHFLMENKPPPFTGEVFRSNNHGFV